MPRPIPSPLRGALLDLDGSLVDSESLHFQSANAVLMELGHRLDLPEFSPYIGWAELPFWAALAERFGLEPGPRELAARREAQFVHLLHGARIEPLPGVRETLECLDRAGVPAAVASSSTRAEIQAILRAARLAEALPVFCSGHDDVARGKPAPDVYLAAAAALEVPAEDCIALEDSATGLAAARAAGAFVVAVPCPSHPDPGLGGADLLLSSLSELPPRLAATC